MMGSTAAGNLTNADHGIYGRANGRIGGANADTVVNTSHAHSTGAARVTSTAYATHDGPFDSEGVANVLAITGIDNAGGGATGASGTAAAKYKRVGRVATGIWMVKT
jgi:hypothetical protein